MSFACQRTLTLKLQGTAELAELVFNTSAVLVSNKYRLLFSQVAGYKTDTQEAQSARGGVLLNCTILSGRVI